MIEITCSECGATLDIYTVNQIGTTVSIKIDPCKDCLKVASDEGCGKCVDDSGWEE